MRHALLFVLLLTSVQNQDRTKPITDSRTTRKQVRPSPVTQQTPDSARSESVSGTQFYTYNSQEENESEAAKIIFDGLLVLFTAGLVWVGYRQAKILEKHEEWMRKHDANLTNLAAAAKENAEAAKLSASEAKRSADNDEQATRLTQRADVLLKDFEVRGDNQSRIVGRDTQLVLHFRNFGPTRANDVVFDFGMWVPGVNKPVPNSTYSKPTSVPVALGAGDEKEVTFNRLCELFKDDVIVGIANGQQSIKFAGKITYKDVFGESHTVECGAELKAGLGAVVADETKIS